MVGIKGTGMAALAELIHADGAIISGSDVPDHFFTEELLNSLNIPYFAGFKALNVPKDCDIVIHSAAYDSRTHIELLRAEELGIPVINYSRALGLYSRLFTSAGIAGVHGKTTTTAMTGLVLRGLKFPFRLLTGSVVPDFGNSATLKLGGQDFIAETCEYRRHFLEFQPSTILLTSVEEDHQDYYPDLKSITMAFSEYIHSLPPNGALVYCNDNTNARKLCEAFKLERPDIQLLPYGFSAEGAYQIINYQSLEGETRFQLSGFSLEFKMHIPGSHNVLNAAGAWALGLCVYRNRLKRNPTLIEMEDALDALSRYKSCKRRSEIVGEKDGILVLDDYAHHPTAIRLTLRGMKEFYKNRRLVVSFMSHTYSRTQALWEEFSKAFEDADLLILHKIYASAREQAHTGVSGEELFKETKKFHSNVLYFKEPEESLKYLTAHLTKGDIFLTMGAGDNWKIGKMFLEARE